MTNRELGNAIRKELKSKGFTSKDVSVSVRDAGYETSARVTIKNPYIRVSEIENVVKRFEVVDRDERTMEILAGGNTFVFCQYEYGIFEDVAAPLVPTAEIVLANMEKYNGCKIAENDKIEIFIFQNDAYAWTIREYNKETNYCDYSKHTYWIRSAIDLAIAMFRFKNIGTIYA